MSTVQRYGYLYLVYCRFILPLLQCLLTDTYSFTSKAETNIFFHSTCDIILYYPSISEFSDSLGPIELI